MLCRTWQTQKTGARWWCTGTRPMHFTAAKFDWREALSIDSIFHRSRSNVEKLWLISCNVSCICDAHANHESMLGSITFGQRPMHFTAAKCWSFQLLSWPYYLKAVRPIIQRLGISKNISRVWHIKNVSRHIIFVKFCIFFAEFYENLRKYVSIHFW